jgi:hypothetical protein
VLEQFTEDSTVRFMPSNTRYNRQDNSDGDIGSRRDSGNGSSGSSRVASNAVLQNVIARLPLKSLLFDLSPADFLNGTGLIGDERMPQWQNHLTLGELDYSMDPKSIQRQSLGALGKYALIGMNELTTKFNEFSEAYPAEVDVASRFLNGMSQLQSLLLEEGAAKWSEKHLKTFQNNSAGLAEGFQYIFRTCQKITSLFRLESTPWINCIIPFPMESICINI